MVHLYRRRRLSSTLVPWVKVGWARRQPRRRRRRQKIVVVAEREQ